MKKIAGIWKISILMILWGLCAFPAVVWADAFEQLGVARPRTSKPAPDFALTDIHGKPVNLSQFKGKPVLINFWATWCGPCREELPSMQRLHDNPLKFGDIQIIAISVDRFNVDKIHQYAQDMHLSFPILHDKDREVRKSYFVRGLPTSYLVDAKGKLRGFISGARKWDGATAQKVFHRLAHPGK